MLAEVSLPFSQTRQKAMMVQETNQARHLSNEYIYSSKQIKLCSYKPMSLDLNIHIECLSFPSESINSKCVGAIQNHCKTVTDRKANVKNEG